MSEREAEVLSALSGGMSNAQISHRLHISVRTVESHISSLLRKFGVADRWALVERAKQDDAEPAGSVAGLPAARTSFVGRDREREALLAAFERSRLVTVLGPGGVGKTRLAVTFAAEEPYPSGGFVDLVPVREGLVAQAVAAVLGVTERPRQPPADAIIRSLGRGRSLLILDNCEHLIDEVAGFVEQVLSACPGVRFLVTSRERLALPGERTVPVPPLPLGSDAETLFVDRARAADPEFTADPAVVTRLCARLDGMPLAIELAAARGVALGPDGLLAGLDDALGLLAGGRGPTERHRSLRAVIEWSYRLLDAGEQRLFRRLAVFAGGFDLDAAVTVTGAGDRAEVAAVLARLVDKSLVHRESGASRWRMLDTIRAFAAAQPEPDRERSQMRYLEWARELAVSLAARIPDGWREEFDLVADDLRAAARTAGPPLAHPLRRALGRLTFARRFLAESLGHFTAAAAAAPAPGEAAKDLRDAAGCAHFISFAGQRPMELLLAAAEQARLAGDGNRQARALARAVEVAARYPIGFATEIPTEKLLRLLDTAASAGDPDDPAVAAGIALATAWTAVPDKLAVDPGRAQAALAAARASGDALLVVAALDALRAAATNAGRLREAHRISLEQLDLLALVDREDPFAAVEIAGSYYSACTDAIAAGDLPTALELARRAERDDLIGSHPFLTTSKLIPALVLTGAVDEALPLAGQLWEAWERAGSPAAGWLSPAVSAIALAHGLRGDDRGFRLWRARAVAVEGDAATSPTRYLTAFTAFVDARLSIHNGQIGQADALVRLVFDGLPRGWYETYARAAGAELAVVAGLADRAERLAEAEPARAENAWARACLLRAAGRLHGDQDALRAAVDVWERIGARFERAVTLLLLPDRAAEGAAELAALELRRPAGSAGSAAEEVDQRGGDRLGAGQARLHGQG